MRSPRSPAWSKEHPASAATNQPLDIFNVTTNAAVDGPSGSGYLVLIVSDWAGEKQPYLCHKLGCKCSVTSIQRSHADS